MNYQSHYHRLVERARNRTLGGYVERHHILPRCIGGSDDRKNIVALTAEEHFVAHQLLMKMHPGVRGLAFAAQAMTIGSGRRGTNKLFGWIRRRYAEAQRGRVKSDKERANIAAAGRARAPRTFSEQAKANMAAANRKTWEERRAAGTHLDVAAKIVATRRANGSYRHTPEQRAAIGIAGRGRVPWNKGMSKSQHQVS